YFFFSSRRRHTRCLSDWSSDVCSSDLNLEGDALAMLDLDLDRVGPLLSKAHIRDHSRRSVVTCLRAQALIDHGEEVCGWRLFRSRVAGDHRDLAVSFHGNGIRKEFPMLRQQLRCER